MLKIYGVTRSRASRNIWLAHELGLPFDQVPVIQAYRLGDPTAADAPLNSRSPAFLAVNPNGHIPSIDDDGLVLHESLAINLYLAKKHGGPLAPANVREDGLMTMWALWAATEVEAHALALLYQLGSTAPEPRDTDLVKRSLAALVAPFAVLDRHLGESGGHMVGDRFTVADINVAEVFRYAMPATELFAAAPRVNAWLAACQSRPGFKTMWAARTAEPA